MHCITLTIRHVYTFMKKGGNPPTQIFQKKNNNSVLLIHWGKRHMNWVYWRSRDSLCISFQHQALPWQQRACIHFTKGRRWYTVLQTLLFVSSSVSRCKAPSEIHMYDVNWVIKHIQIHLQTNTSSAFNIKSLGLLLNLIVLLTQKT